MILKNLNVCNQVVWGIEFYSMDYVFVPQNLIKTFRQQRYANVKTKINILIIIFFLNIKYFLNIFYY